MINVQKTIRILYTKQGLIDFDQVHQACNYLTKNGVIALPTDTLYGIAARVDDSKALERIYKIKGRDTDKPLAICVSSVDHIERVAELGIVNKKILNSLLPGPITIVLRRSSALNRDLNPNVDTIGVRVPDHNFMIAVSERVGPIALTSANRSGEKSPLRIEDFKELWDDLDCIFDSGPARNITLNDPQVSPLLHRSGSTVVDLSRTDKKVYSIIREGCALNRTINILHRFGYRSTPRDKQAN